MLKTIRRIPLQESRGFTIPELVIAFIIIGILTLILTPTLIQRAAEARINAAQQDLQHLCDAEERVAIDTGYLFRIYALNDVPGPGDGVSNASAADRIQSLRDNDDNISTYTTPRKLFINPATQDYLDDFDTIFRRMTNPSQSTTGADTGVSEKEFGWHGPYLNWKTDRNHNDWPDDPWGNDYLFFTKAGMIQPPVYPLEDRSDQFYTEDRENNTTLIFDRPTFLSMGPDGRPGDAKDPNTKYGQGDDIYRQFGGGN